jgi:hypothetical protein
LSDFTDLFELAPTEFTSVQPLLAGIKPEVLPDAICRGNAHTNEKYQSQGLPGCPPLRISLRDSPSISLFSIKFARSLIAEQRYFCRLDKIL